MDVWIKIRSMFEGKGAQDATDGLNKLGQAGNTAAKGADKVAESSGKMGEASMGAAHMLHGLEAVAHGSYRGMFAAATGAKHLLSALGLAALNPIMMVIAGIGIAVTALVGYFKKASEEAAKLKEENIKLAIETQKFKEIRMDRKIEDYNRLADSIGKSAAAQERMHAAEMKQMDALTGAKLAKLDLQEVQELSSLRPEDEEGRKSVAFKYATKRQDVQDDAEVEKAAKESLAAQDKVSIGRQQLFLHEEALRVAVKKLTEATNEQESIKEASNKLAKVQSAMDMAKSARDKGLQTGVLGAAAAEIWYTQAVAPLEEKASHLQEYLKIHEVKDLRDQRKGVEDMRLNVKNETRDVGTAQIEAENSEINQGKLPDKIATGKVKLDDEVHAFNNKYLQDRQKELQAKLAQDQKDEQAAQQGVASEDAATTAGHYSYAGMQNALNAVKQAQDRIALDEKLFAALAAQWAQQNATTAKLTAIVQNQPPNS